MPTSSKQLTESLRFQLNLLRLAVIPHSSRRPAQGADAAHELVELARQIPVAQRRQKRSRKSLG